MHSIQIKRSSFSQLHTEFVFPWYQLATNVFLYVMLVF